MEAQECRLNKGCRFEKIRGFARNNKLDQVGETLLTTYGKLCQTHHTRGLSMSMRY